MCGIAGIISSDLSTERRETGVRAMCAAMQHRGPDDQGLATRHEATIGGCRLAIFDPANGHQPMVSPDGRWTLVFNGAIYNFRSLRSELTGSGWSFRTECDTEVLLAAFCRWGTGCLDRLRGMFAFAVWDDQERTLTLARDSFGIKPLYYRHAGRRLSFASELNALLTAEETPAGIDPAGVADYLAWLSVPAPRTIYRGVLSLRPGECAVLRRDQLELKRSGGFGRTPQKPACDNYDAFLAELRVRLEDSIRAHLLADVPVGAFLSGGLDSAAIVGLMTRVSGSPLRTFSIGFDEPEYSETSAAEATARHFGARHHTHVLTGAEVARDLDRLLGAFDQPTGDGINTYYASQAARQGGVTVALSGLGGDELFGGYPSFRDTPRLARILPWWHALPAAVRRAIVARLERGDTRHRKLADVLRHARNIQEIGALQRRVFSEDKRLGLLTPSVAALVPAGIFHPELPNLAAEFAGAAPFDIVGGWELRTYMADVLLRDSDVMSMRHSLELRVPFIDRPLVEWLWQQPADARSRAGKSALFDALRDVLPPAMADRPKHGFTLPFPVWMKRELRPFLDEVFSEASVARSGFFAPRAVHDLWAGFLRRDDSREWSRVWSLAVLIAFVNRRSSPNDRSAPVTEIAPRPSEVGAAALQPAVTPRPNRRVLVMAPEMYASEGGIPRILQLYLRAVCDTAGPSGRVRLLALNDRDGDGLAARQTFNGALEVSRACARSKVRFIQHGLRLAHDCDAIICGHVRQLPVAWLARQLNPSLRYYLVAHGIEVWEPFTPAQRTAIRGAERVLCVSDFTRRELLKYCPLPAGRAVVLPNALDPFFVIGPGRPLRECPPTILVVTRLTYADRYKGVQHLIEAMPAVRAAIPDARLRIVGRGDDVPRLERLRHDLGLDDVIDLTGYLSDAKVADELRNCRLFALPSRKEGFGLVFLEAMAHGRPCLGANAGGIPEVITPETGVLVPYGDVPALAAGIVDGLRRDWDEDRILARAREFSFSSFKQRLAPLIAA